MYKKLEAKIDIYSIYHPSILYFLTGVLAFFFIHNFIFNLVMHKILLFILLFLETNRNMGT